MKTKIHSSAGVIGFICITVFILATVFSEIFGSHETVVAVKKMIFRGMFLLMPALLIAGASGVSLLGKRTDALALTKQKRGPIAFMTGLFILLPSSYFLSSWAQAGSFGVGFYSLQTLELIGSAVCFIMIGLNIRDGLALTGRIRTANTSSTIKGANISERDGGPLVATDIPILKNADGQSLDDKPLFALCRCGASKNKPYCDGTHAKIGFDSHPSDNRTKDDILIYEGKEVNVHYNRLLCSHAAECGKRNKAAFDSSRKPWIIPDNASKDDIISIVTACPSGAIRYSFPEKQPEQPPIKEVSITIEHNGPYRVSGIPLTSAREAKGAHPQKYVLCRCGASKNKPYCDGTHHDIGWKDNNETD